MSYKLIVLVRTDLKMSKGKIVAQSGHAIVDATIQAIRYNKLAEWRNCGEPIIALKVKDCTTMNYIINAAKKKGILYGQVIDAGLTEIAPGTVSVGFIGPDKVEKIDKITGQLKCL